jgi:hypothetical protein
MPVVINDFEVVVDNQQKSPQAAAETQEPQPAAKRGATPHEVENIFRREQERLARVQAH